MLIEIQMDAFDFVALLVGPGLRIGIGIGGADGAGIIGTSVWRHFLHVRTPTRKIASTGSWRGESPVSLCHWGMVKFLEQLTGIELSICPQSLNC